MGDRDRGRGFGDINLKSFDAASEAGIDVPIPDVAEKFAEIEKVGPANSGAFADTIVDPILRLKGDTIPVSAMPINGAIPTGTKRLEYKGVPGNPAIWIDKLPYIVDPNIAQS